MPTLREIELEHWERLKTVPEEQRHKWQKDLVEAARKFNADPLIANTADARRTHAIQAIKDALPMITHLGGMFSGSYYYNPHAKPQEAAALKEFFPTDKYFEEFVGELGKANNYKEIKDWGVATIDANIRQRFSTNVSIIRDMVGALLRSNEIDRETWLSVDYALQTISFHNAVNSGPDLSPNGNSCFNWNQFRSNLRRLYALAPEDSVSSKLFPAIITAGERSGLFAAIEQAYGNSGKTSALTL